MSFEGLCDEDMILSHELSGSIWIIKPLNSSVQVAGWVVRTWDLVGGAGHWLVPWRSRSYLGPFALCYLVAVR